MLARSKLSHRPAFTLALSLALGIGGLLLATAAVTTAIASVHHGSTGSGPVLVAGLHFTYPTLNGAAALLLGLAATSAVAIVLDSGRPGDSSGGTGHWWIRSEWSSH